jgi:hypothetical protein
MAYLKSNQAGIWMVRMKNKTVKLIFSLIRDDNLDKQELLTLQYRGILRYFMKRYLNAYSQIPWIRAKRVLQRSNK